jgi:hypothetical protein
MGTLGDVMSPQPAWLPDLICVDPWCDELVEMLYAVFDIDFRQSKPVFEGREIHYFPELRDGGKEVIFWHLITCEDETRSKRIPEENRAARLSWVRCLIENCAQAEVLYWDYLEHNGDVKTYIWLVEDDFLILLKRLKDGTRRLLTSFYIEYESYKGKLQKKYNKRLTQ